MKEVSLGHELDAEPYGVREDTSAVAEIALSAARRNPDAILDELKNDRVILVAAASPQEIDPLLLGVAERLGLRSQLELQATFAAVRGHRRNVGKYFMSVNQRTDYQFINSHSEGTRSIGIQLASFYCYENTTDGGVTILQQVDQDSPHWDSQRAVKVKVDTGGRTLSPGELAQIRISTSVNLPEDFLCDDDEVLSEGPPVIPGVRAYTVLEKSRPIFSRILQREMHVYWDNVASIDFDSGKEFVRALRRCGLLHTPTDGLDITKLDYCHPRRVWNSGVKFESFFRSRITRRLAAGDLILFNNLTWTHAASNWTPGSGSRKIAAAFA